MEDSVINAREVARSRWLVLFGAKGKRVYVDTCVGGTGVVLEGLDNVEVAALTLGETVLAVELELGSYDGVLTPAVHVESGLSKDEGASIRDKGARAVGVVTEGDRAPLVAGRGKTRGLKSAGHLEEARGVDETSLTINRGGAAEGVDGVGKGIDGIGVVEGLGTECAVKDTSSIEGRAIVNVGIRLDNPDEFLARVVEVKLDLVGRRAYGFITSELDLLEEVLVGVLGHLAALVSVEENVVNIEGGSNKGLLVGSRDGLGSGCTSKGLDGPEALTNRADVKVNLDLVVLEGNKGKGKAGVAAEPEKKGNVEGGLRKGVAGSANLVGATGRSAGARDIRESGVSDVGKLGGVTNHLEVSTLLLGRKGKLVPDVHPVTVLAVNALATNLNLNLGDELLTNVV